MAINSDLFSSKVFLDLYSAMKATNQTVISTPAAAGQIFDFLFDSEHVYSKLEPHSFVAAPVYDSFSKQKMSGMVIGLTPFHNLLDFLFDKTVKGIIVVFTDNCGTTITYDVSGANVTFLGYSDLHSPSYDLYKKSGSLEWNKTSAEGLCYIDFHIYPSSTLERSYATTKPYLYSGIVLIPFFLTSVLIFLYDMTVTKRQEKTMRSALQNGALIESLFPAIVRDRLLEDSRLDALPMKRGIERKNNENAVKSRPCVVFPMTSQISFQTQPSCLLMLQDSRHGRRRENHFKSLSCWKRFTAPSTSLQSGDAFSRSKQWEIATLLPVAFQRLETTMP